MTSPQSPRSPYRLCVAPMMAWTDRHCRVLHRLLAPSARLYAEMTSTDALLHGATRPLRFSAVEHPVAFQVGGNDPRDLACAAAMAERAGFDEVNLNVGCPSERVRKGAIGACLMREPARVAAGVAAMRDAVGVPITVKCRLGAQDSLRAPPADDYGQLRDFVGQVAAAGVAVFIVHARTAVLEGLTPAQNRSVPPLRPDLVRRLKRDHPQLAIVVNGGIRTTQALREHLVWADGVMIGRAAYRQPQWLAEADAALFDHPPLAPQAALSAYLPYVENQLREGVKLADMTRHLQNLFNGRRGARRYRRYLAAHDRTPEAGIETIAAAVALVEPPAGAWAAPLREKEQVVKNA